MEKVPISNEPFPPMLVLSPVSRRPMMLPEATVETVLARPILGSQDCCSERSTQALDERVSIVVVTINNLVFNRLCLESVLANTEYPNYEIIVVENGSTDGTRGYLRDLA